MPPANMESVRPVEWEIRAPDSDGLLAIVRLLHLGPMREIYYRAVTGNPDREQRKLIGYWSSLELAADAVISMYEQSSGEPHPRAMPAQKPPPRQHPAVR